MKCPKCSGRVVEFCDYLGNGNGSCANKKIEVRHCQICGWRQEVNKDKVVDNIIDKAELQECKCGKLVKDGVCEDCKPVKRKPGRPPKKNTTLFTVPKDTVEMPLAEIYLHFYTRDEELLNKLKQSAIDNRRTLDNEILYRLDNG